jgi:hypothetical protein
MATKIHINLHQGIIDVEGNDDFVLKVYEDFRDALVKSRDTLDHVDADLDIEESSASAKVGTANEKGTSRSGRKPRRSTAPHTLASNGTKSRKVTNYQPKLDKTLDTAKLAEYLSSVELRNNAETILVFSDFITQTLGQEHCTMDQIFTCFSVSKTKFPKKFGQAFIDTRGANYGYIDFSSPEDIKISMIGQNHLNQGIKKK